MDTKERENFNRNSTLIVEHTKNGLTDLIDLNVTQGVYGSFENFINAKQHEIYHLCYNRSRCCQCPPGCTLPSARVLHPPQLELLLNKIGPKKMCHNPGRTGDFCCCAAHRGLTTNVLDATLARCLLVNFCQDVFWYSCLTAQKRTLEDFLTYNKHDIYHLYDINSRCCQCPSSYVVPTQRPALTTTEWNQLFSTSCPPCPNDTNRVVSGIKTVCSWSVTTGITVAHLGADLSKMLIEHCCPLRKSVEKLVQLRNNVFGHVKEAKISDNDYAKYRSEIEPNLLLIAQICCKESEVQQQLNDLDRRTLDGALLMQTIKEQLYTAELLSAQMSEESSNMKEEITTRMAQETTDMKIRMAQESAEIKEEITTRMEQESAEIKDEITTRMAQESAEIKDEITTKMAQVSTKIKEITRMIAQHIDERMKDMSTTLSSQVGQDMVKQQIKEKRRKLLDENLVNIVKKQQQLANKDGLTDIVQGSKYKDALHEGADVSLTFTFNTDGVAIFASSKKGSLWPVYLAINELPVKMRFSRKYLIPCLLHCQVEKPNMVTYLRPLMEELQVLNEKGITVRTSCGTMVIKGKLLLSSLDLPARALVANMKQFNGKYGCSFCLDEGQSPPGNPMHRYFPFLEQSTLRTHLSVLENARTALGQTDAVHGIKGISALMLLKYINLPHVFAVDWMHCVLLGMTKALMNLWFNSTNKEKDFFIGNKIELLDKRFLDIKIPDFVSRRQRTLSDYKHWKASECREWLIHFSVPVLFGILNPTAYTHYVLFVSGICILLKDDLQKKDVDQAEMLLINFCRIFPDIYGVTRQTMNLHMIKHLPSFVRMYGPLYGYSCFGFESMNSFLKNMVHGSRHVNKQVSFAVGMAKQLTSVLKRSTTEDADKRTRQLFLKLGSKFIQEDKLQAIQIEALGRKRSLSQRSQYFELIPENHQLLQVHSFYRLKKGNNIYKSKDYQHAKTRNDYVVSYNENETEKFGIIQVFLCFNDTRYAVVKPMKTVPFSIHDHTKRYVTIAALKECLGQQQLCGHISRVDSYGENTLIKANDLKKKCVLIKITPVQTYVTIPPNLLEHD